MELTFEFADKAKWKTGKFVFDDIQIVGEGDDVSVQYNDIELYLDGKLYDGDISTFSSNSLSADELFESVLNSYIRNNRGEFAKFGPEWSIFSKIMDMTEKQGDLIMKLPVCKVDDIVLYELELATPDNTYYSYGDSFMVLDKSGEVVTDYEEFYSEAMMEDIYNILTGKTTCLYMGYSPKEMIKECGGEDAYIEEFSSFYED